MLIKAGLLIDGTGGAPQYNCYVAIENGKILAVGREADFSQHLLSQALDYSAYTLLPGLIDTHVHLFLEGIDDMKLRQSRWRENKGITLLRAAKNLELTLKKGVTTVRDLGGPSGIAIILKHAVNQGLIAGPRVLTCNQAISITGGHFHYAGGREADGPEEMAKAVREQVEAGAECIKLMLTGMVNFQTEKAGAVELAKEELQAAVLEARRFGCPVSVHANGVEGVRQALAAGVDTIEHCILLNEETTDLIGDSAVYWIPTLMPLLKMFNYSRERFVTTLPEAGLDRVYAQHCAMVRRGINAGANVIAGTDAGALGVEHGDVWQELALFITLGMAPLDAIAAATGKAAKALGVEDITGVVKAGKNADLLVVQGNPLNDMKVLRNIVQVYRDGVRYN